MAVTTKTQTEQTHTKASSDTESTKPREQLLRDELKEASQPGTEPLTFGRLVTCSCPPPHFG
jgi:hypothetical protein